VDLCEYCKVPSLERGEEARKEEEDSSMTLHVERIIHHPGIYRIRKALCTTNILVIY
jgi:hypothetical protein